MDIDDRAGKLIKKIIGIIFIGAFFYLLFELKLYQNVSVHDDALERMHTWDNVVDTSITLAIAFAIVIPLYILWNKSKESEDDEDK